MASAVIVRILGDASNLKRALGDSESAMEKWKKKTLAVSAAATTALVGVAVLAKKAIDQASNTAEAQAKAMQVFGKEGAAAIEQFSNAAGDGLSKLQAVDYAAAFGSIGRVMGLSGQDAAGLGKQYTQLAVDLASFNNTSVDEAFIALRSGLTGEFEPLKRFQVFLNDATLSQEALRLGIKKSGGTWSQQEKFLLTNAILTRQTSLAQGDFARTADGLANQQRELSANVSDLSGQLGALLLPAVSKVADKMLEFLKLMQSNPAVFQAVVVAIGVMVGALGLLAAAQVAVWLSNPFTAIGLAVVAVAASIVWLSTRFDWFKNGIAKVMDIVYDLWVGRWAAMVRFVSNAVGGIAGAIGKVAGFFGLDGIQDAANGVSNLANNLEAGAKAVQQWDAGSAFKSAIDALENFKMPNIAGPTQVNALDAQGFKLGKGMLDGFGKGAGTTAGGSGSGKSAADVISDVIKAARDKVKDAKDLAADIRKAFDLSLNAMTITDTGRSATLQYDLDQQLKKLKAFRFAIDKLRKGGLRGALIDKLVAGGPDSLGAAEEILNTRGGIGAANKTSSAIDAESKKLAYGEVVRRTGVDLNKDKPVKVTFDVTGADSEMRALIRKIVRVDGGGDVAVAFGRK